MQQYFGISKKDNNLYLNKDELNHIKNVMRMKENDEVIIVYEGKSYICSLNSDLLSASIKEVFKGSENESNLTVYMPLLSEEKMSFILQHGKSYRLSKPVLDTIISSKNIESIANVNIMCSLDKTNVKSICKVLTVNNCNDTISLVFGPEGGLSKNEEDILEAKGFIKTSLGDTVLRTETVPLMIASILKYLKESE